MSGHQDLRSIIGHATEKAALYQVELPKNFIPRLGRYAKELLEEDVNVNDILYAVDRVVAGEHSPYLLRSFVAGRLGCRGGDQPADYYQEAVKDYPDFDSRN